MYELYIVRFPKFYPVGMRLPIEGSPWDAYGIVLEIKGHDEHGVIHLLRGEGR
jgi:hypothetical protein